MAYLFLSTFLPLFGPKASVVFQISNTAMAKSSASSFLPTTALGRVVFLAVSLLSTAMAESLARYSSFLLITALGWVVSLVLLLRCPAITPAP